jgi:hypothetical protein
MARLSWRKQPNEPGLRRVVQGRRGLELRYDGETIGHVHPVTKQRFDVVGWYWYAVSERYDIPLFNSYGIETFETPESAKAACDKYVREHFTLASAA